MICSGIWGVPGREGRDGSELMQTGVKNIREKSVKCELLPTHLHFQRYTLKAGGCCEFWLSPVGRGPGQGGKETGPEP